MYEQDCMETFTRVVLCSDIVVLSIYYTDPLHLISIVYKEIKWIRRSQECMTKYWRRSLILLFNSWIFIIITMLGWNRMVGCYKCYNSCVEEMWCNLVLRYSYHTNDYKNLDYWRYLPWSQVLQLRPHLNLSILEIDERQIKT